MVTKFSGLSLKLFKTETENATDEIGLDDKTDTEPNVAIVPDETAASATSNASIEAAPAVNNPSESGSVEYQEAPSASAVPVPTFTPQQPHTVPTPGIAAHSTPQNLKTLPQGKEQPFLSHPPLVLQFNKL